MTSNPTPEEAREALTIAINLMERHLALMTPSGMGRDSSSAYSVARGRIDTLRALLSPRPDENRREAVAHLINVMLPLATDHSPDRIRETADAILALQPVAAPLSEGRTDTADHWWLYGNYTGGDCPNCGRERLLLCKMVDGTPRVICEKCSWEPAVNDYCNEAIR
jgi:predicted RNA-binding Zn-ribbon protein involved in translation (DUF1610 family)